MSVELEADSVHVSLPLEEKVHVVPDTAEESADGAAYKVTASPGAPISMLA